MLRLLSTRIAASTYKIRGNRIETQFGEWAQRDSKTIVSAPKRAVIQIITMAATRGYAPGSVAERSGSRSASRCSFGLRNYSKAVPSTNKEWAKEKIPLNRRNRKNVESAESTRAI